MKSNNYMEVINNKNARIVKYKRGNLYILTDYFCKHCPDDSDKKGILKYEVLEIIIKSIRNIERICSVICNNKKCLYNKNSINVKTCNEKDMIKKYNKLILKSQHILDVDG